MQGVFLPAFRQSLAANDAYLKQFQPGEASIVKMGKKLMVEIRREEAVQYINGTKANSMGQIYRNLASSLLDAYA